MQIKRIIYGTEEYQQMIELRSEVLRKPLGLHFSEEYLEKEKDTVLIGAFEATKIVGCCILRELSAEVIQLQQMAVLPHLQKRGIGKKLIRFAEDFAIKAGHSRLFLHARKTATGFYENLGYQIFGDEFEEVTIPHYMMKKDLMRSEQ